MDFDMISRAPGYPGWVELRIRGEGQPRVLAKFEKRDGRAVITRLIIAGAMDSATLRAIPLGRIESAVNHPKFGPPPIWAPYAPEVLAEFAGRDLFPDEFAQIEEALNRYLQGSAMPGASRKKADRKRPRRPLSRPDGADPEGFSRRVAEAYNDAVLGTRAPAVALAEEADVPVTTVHRWIREARQRGFLPPARKGRAG